MWCGRILLVILALLPLLDAQAHATTWHVERDGSGDYTTIQPAVDGAAPGDTIWIGAGRYTEFAPFTTPGRWTEDVYVVISVDNLTLVGDGPDETIIGPTEPNFIGFGPKGVVALSDISNFKIISLTLENIRDGIYRSWGGQLEIRDCVFRGCDYGIFTWADNGTLVKNCQFLDNFTNGFSAHGPARNIEIRECNFISLDEGVGFYDGTENAHVYQCTFTGGRVGTKFSNYSNGGVYDCIFENIQNIALDVSIASSATLEGNYIQGGSVNLYVGTVSHVNGTDNILMGGTYATIENSHSTFDYHGNHILHVGGYAVLLNVFLNPPDVIIDLSDNYWGTTSTDSISEWIWDGNDDSAIHAFVNYEPFSDHPHPTEKKSLGEVKALYR